MISLQDFQKKSHESGLDDDVILSLYDMSRNFCVLCEAHQRKPGERLKLYKSLRQIFSKAAEGKNCFLGNILADFLRVEVNKKLNALENNSTSNLDAKDLDEIGKILKKHLGWTRHDTRKANETLVKAQLENKKALGSKSWKLGILAGIAAIAAAGTGYAIYKHAQDKKESEKK